MLRIVLHNKACRWKVGVSPTRTSPSLYSSTPKIEKKKQKQRVRAERTAKNCQTQKLPQRELAMLASKRIPEEAKSFLNVFI